MKTSRATIRPFVFSIASMLLFAFGQAQAGESCHKVHGKGVGDQDPATGVAEAQIKGAGFLNGSTVAQFTRTGFAFPIATFVGTVSYETKQGTLDLTINGTLDVTTGVFAIMGPITGSTGKLAGATGTISAQGIQDLTDGSFEEDLGGVICVDLAP